LHYLTPEWLEFRLRRFVGFHIAPGTDLRIQHVVTGGPDGDVRYHDQIRDGSLVGCGLGDIDDPDFTLTRKWSDDLGLLRGELDPYTAVVDGRVKIMGDEIRLLTLLPLLQDYSTELEGIARDISAATDE
jgi:alkyl sulfatase BDS1-like metallo-beta-lactamase superfamily hydrolase